MKNFNCYFKAQIQVITLVIISFCCLSTGYTQTRYPVSYSGEHSPCLNLIEQYRALINQLVDDKADLERRLLIKTVGKTSSSGNPDDSNKALIQQLRFQVYNLGLEKNRLEMKVTDLEGKVGELINQNTILIKEVEKYHQQVDDLLDEVKMLKQRLEVKENYIRAQHDTIVIQADTIVKQRDTINVQKKQISKDDSTKTKLRKDLFRASLRIYYLRKNMDTTVLNILNTARVKGKRVSSIYLAFSTGVIRGGNKQYYFTLSYKRKIHRVWVEQSGYIKEQCTVNYDGTCNFPIYFTNKKNQERNYTRGKIKMRRGFYKVQVFRGKEHLYNYEFKVR